MIIIFTKPSTTKCHIDIVKHFSVNKRQDRDNIQKHIDFVTNLSERSSLTNLWKPNESETMCVMSAAFTPRTPKSNMPDFCAMNKWYPLSTDLPPFKLEKNKNSIFMYSSKKEHIHHQQIYRLVERQESLPCFRLVLKPNWQGHLCNESSTLQQLFI